MCGRRHMVVMMTCLGMLISIGSRAVFTMVVTHIIEKSSTSSSIFPMKCVNENETNPHWSKAYVFEFQMVYFAATLVTQVPAGILSARFSPRRVSGVATFLTSILTICVRYSLKYEDSWPTFLIRILQGLIEGSLVPAFNGVLAAWAPKSEKSILVVAAYSGAYLSTFVADIVSGILICKVPDVGSPLYLYGGIGILWAIIWLTCIHDSPAVCPGLSERERQLFNLEDEHSRAGGAVACSEIPWRKILTSLPLWAIFFASFNRNWIFAILVTQLPQFFKDNYTMTPAEYGIYAGIPHVLMTIVLIPVGLTVNKILQKHMMSHTAVRKIVETIGFGTEGVCMLILGVLHPKDYKIAVVLICVGVGVSGFAISGYQVNCLDLAPRYTSILTGIIRMGTIGSVISQLLATELSTQPGGWGKLFIIAGALHLLGVVFYLIFASGDRQPWAEDHTRSVQGDQPSESVAYANGYESDESESLLSKTLRIETLFSKTLRVERLENSNDHEESSWFLSTI